MFPALFIDFVQLFDKDKLPDLYIIVIGIHKNNFDQVWL